MKKTLFVMLLLIGAMAMFVGFNQLADASEQEQLTGLEITNKISEEWKLSGKQFTYSALNYGQRGGTSCTRCHDGMVFADQPDSDDVPSLRKSDYNLEDAEGAAAYAAALEKRPHVIGITCQACHSGYGKETMNTGVVNSPALGTIEGLGAGATCVYCHDGRYDGGPVQQLATFEGGGAAQGTHYSAAALLVTGKAMEYDDVTYPSSVHGNLEDSCVTCHMPQTNEGYASHAFGVKSAPMTDAELQSACGSCHAGIDREYIKNLQDEIKDLSAKLRVAIDASYEEMGLTEATGITPRGQTRNAEMTKDQYIAEFNYALVGKVRYEGDTATYDGTLGVHNPRYARALLNESLKRLTAE